MIKKLLQLKVEYLDFFAVLSSLRGLGLYFIKVYFCWVVPFYFVEKESLVTFV